MPEYCTLETDVGDQTTRAGHINMFAVTNLCQMTNSGGDEDGLCNRQGMTTALTMHRRMWRFGIWFQ